MCRTRIIVSLPIDVTDSEEYAKLEENGVKGRYVAVERIQELQNGNLEWRVLTSSTPGGTIPQFVVESSMASTISQVRLRHAALVLLWLTLTNYTLIRMLRISSLG